MVNDGEFLPQSWLQTSEQYLQQEANLSRSTKPLAKHAMWTSSCRQPPTVLEVNKHTRPQDTGEVQALNWKTPSQLTPGDRPNLLVQTPRMMTDLDARMYQESSETLRRVQARDYHQRRSIHALKSAKHLRRPMSTRITARHCRRGMDMGQPLDKQVFHGAKQRKPTTPLALSTTALRADLPRTSRSRDWWTHGRPGTSLGSRSRTL